MRFRFLFPQGSGGSSPLFRTTPIPKRNPASVGAVGENAAGQQNGALLDSRAVALVALLLVGCGAEVHVEALDAGGDAEVQDGGAAALLVSCDGVAAGGWGYTATLTGDHVAIVCQAGGAVSDASCKLGAPCACAVGAARFELLQDGSQWGVRITSGGDAVSECWR